MKSGQLHRQVFRSGSKTYFNSSVFFPRAVREEVFRLYGFVRVADNFVDSVPQRGNEFKAFVESYLAAREGKAAGDPIIDSFVDLERRRGFPQEWTMSFLASMEADLHQSRYDTIDQTLEYIYGSAEVIGLYMARIMRLDPAADFAARMLGRSMQLINFIRDIDEDNSLGRTYLPMQETTLTDLSDASARKAPDEFRRFVRAQLNRYREWQSEAEAGYRFIPRRYLVPIRTASDMYNWTAKVIESDPFVVFARKVKPSRSRIFLQIAKNFLIPHTRGMASHD